MNIVVEIQLPTDGFALGELVSTRLDIRIELERIVPTGEGTMPFFWVLGDDPSFVTDVPSRVTTIDSVEMISETETGALCRAEWSDEDDIHAILVRQGATLLHAEGNCDGWLFRIRFPDHECASRFREACDEASISYEVRRIDSLPELRVKQYDLTDEQREALVTAFESGYFRVPRETSLSELAESLDISPQAASGRLRRGLDRVLDSTLFP
ncbi:helix-turn-helix domain-containing protein [Haladaptatus caseinilyticus]|uniref:helix-turn-helix domain-containing protein n=1 Tax=Haladaptatus caseinilyticus TaxID=2993314 RepID=UPI00224AC7AA|nr:bacterio-opsin activator domain-containing protein [Haladaptatus caseinilyticus]